MLYSSSEPLQQLRQLLTPPEQIPLYLITLIPAAISLPPEDHPQHTLALSQAATASSCGLQEGCSRQVLLLLEALLGPGGSLSLQEDLQLEGKSLLANAVKGRGANAAAAVEGAVGVSGEAALGQPSVTVQHRSTEHALPEEGLKSAVVEVLEGDKGMQQQPQQQPQPSAGRNLQRAQALGPLLSHQVTSDEPKKKRQRREAGYAVPEDQDEQHQERLQQAKQLSTYPCSTAATSKGGGTRPDLPEQHVPLQQQQPAQLQQQLPQQQGEVQRQPEHTVHQGLCTLTDSVAEWVGEGTAEETVAAANEKMRDSLHSMSSGNTGGVQLGSPMGRGSSNTDELEMVPHQDKVGQSGAGAAVMDQVANQSTAGQAKGPLVIPQRKVSVLPGSSAG